jgi:hypothetical protein
MDMLSSKVNEIEKKVSDINRKVESVSTTHNSSMMDNTFELMLNSKLKHYYDKTKLDKMLEVIENNLHNINKNGATDVEQNKKQSKISKSILLDKDGIDNEAITNQIKKQMSKSERLLRNEYNHQFEDIESKIVATTKAVESRMQDYEELIGEKMKLIDKKILESLSERS